MKKDRDCETCQYGKYRVNIEPCYSCKNYNNWVNDGSFEDNVVSAPTHYTSGNIECIDAIRSALTEEQFRGYCKGNVLKYTWREKLKGGDEDLKKALQYLEFMEVK